MSTSSKRSSEMVYLDIPLTSWELCLKNYGQTGALESPNSVEGQWMCAGGEGKDVCQGFGGGPLFVQESGIYSQVEFCLFNTFCIKHSLQDRYNVLWVGQLRRC